MCEKKKIFFKSFKKLYFCHFIIFERYNEEKKNCINITYIIKFYKNIIFLSK